MDVSKLRNVVKLPRTAKKSVFGEPKFTEEEKKTVDELKKLYLETIKLDVDLQLNIYNMEKAFEEKHNEIFDKRHKILNEYKKKVSEDAQEPGPVANFWLKVLKVSYTEYISKKDEVILSYLSDVRSKLYSDPVVKFEIEFHFEPNEFFSDRILTKTYYLNCLPDMEDPLTYDGAEIYKCEGCVINWTGEEKDVDRKTSASFFEFFSPPALPEDMEDPTYADINAILQNDFELGFYLKERVIPKAVIFFTGEIADCQSSDSESDDSDEADEDEEAAGDEETAANE